MIHTIIGLILLGIWVWLIVFIAFKKLYNHFSKQKDYIKELNDDLMMDVYFYEIGVKKAIKTVNMVYVPPIDSLIKLDESNSDGKMLLVKRILISEFGSVVELYGEIILKSD